MKKLKNKRRLGTLLCISTLLIGATGVSIYKYINNKNKTYYNPINNANILLSFRPQYIVLPEPPPKEQLFDFEMPKYDIDLSPKYQMLVYNLCIKNNLSYEFVLAIMYQESRFNPNAINYNKNKTIDEGLFQLNDKFMSVHRERAIKYCGLDKNITFNPWNPDHNIRAGIGGIIEYRDYYKEKGVSEDDMLKYLSNTLHMGITGYKQYIKKTGKTSRSYDKLIYKNKEKLETSNTLD